MPQFLRLYYRIWKDRYEPIEPELRSLSALAQNGCFIDIGANVGNWSKRGADIFRCVHAFEPDDRLAELLRTTMPSNVLVHAVALSDRMGTGQFAVPVIDGNELTTRASLEPGANPGFSEVVRKVPLATLDSFRLRDISVIKIDVEGHEGSVLDGAAQTIARERPIIIIEIEERHHPCRSHSVFDRLTEQGYICCFICDKQLNLFELKMLDELQPLSSDAKCDTPAD